MEELQEKFKVYLFNKERNKCILKGNSVNKLKQKIIERDGLYCYLCKNIIPPKTYYELEHKIPIEIGGKIFCLSNLGLVCSKCHSKKTLMDRKVIKIIKDSGIFVHGLSISFKSLEEIRQLYCYWSNIIKDCQVKFEKYHWGNPEIDYEQVIDMSNRECENGNN